MDKFVIIWRKQDSGETGFVFDARNGGFDSTSSSWDAKAYQSRKEAESAARILKKASRNTEFQIAEYTE